MEQEWWYASSGQKIGPLPLSDILQALGNGQIALETLVWQPGWKDWRKLTDVEEIRTQILEVLRNQQRRVPPPLPSGASDIPARSGDRVALSANLFAPDISTAPAVPQVRPWVRFWARLFDIYVFSFVFGAVSVFLFSLSVSDKGQELLLGMTALFVWTFVEPAFLSSIGTTPGKWLMRIKVASANGHGISYRCALSRSLKVWWRGLGIGFPFVFLFTMAIAAGRLRKNGITSWDREGAFTVTHGRVGLFRASLMAVLMFVFFLAVAVAGSMSQKAQRGKEAAEEAARYGLSVQEYRRRNTRAEVLCDDGKFVNLDCVDDVLSGRR